MYSYVILTGYQRVKVTTLLSASKCETIRLSETCFSSYPDLSWIVIIFTVKLFRHEVGYGFQIGKHFDSLRLIVDKQPHG